MIALAWSGKAVSKNRMHRPAHGRLIHTDEYKSFLESLAFTWIAAKPAINEPLPLKNFSLIVKVSIGSRLDPQNLIDPICDSLERAGIVQNDRALGSLYMPNCVRHAHGMDDQIIVIVDRLGGELVEEES